MLTPTSASCTACSRRYAARRSDRQNRYLWGVVMPLAAHALSEAWGETFDPLTAHEFFKAQFLSRPVVNRNTGEVMGHVIGSSAVLTTVQFTEYVDKVILWCAEYLGMQIPAPNEMI